tara:strand:- start:1029 stop:1757 length:729 start_codon:yes stop_codon:yes gene_type:complete
MIYDGLQPSTIAFILVFIGAFIQTSIGFGMAILAVPLLYLISPDYIPAPICSVAFIISMINAYKYRSYINLGDLKAAFIGRIPGSIAGGLFLLYVSQKVLAIWVGVLVLTAVVVSLLPYRFKATPMKMGWAGFFSGFFATSSAIGGPPIALVMQHQKTETIRANLAFFFTIGSLFTFVIQAQTGNFTWYHIDLTLPLIPAALLGYALATKTTHTLPKNKMRIGILFLCTLASLIELWHALTQ